MNTNEIIKKVLMHRHKVTSRLSSIANDIASRGRRHDNSYTGGTELVVIQRIVSCPIEEKDKYIELLESMHSNTNDYMPKFHKGIHCMNMLQLLEYIADKIATVDEEIENPTMEDYNNKVFESLGDLSPDLYGVIESTIDYFINRNECIKKVVDKTEKVKEDLNEVTIKIIRSDS